MNEYPYPWPKETDEPMPCEWWLEQLPEPYRSEALANQDTEKGVNTMREAINAAFTWSSTEQGGDYWAQLRISVIGETFVFDNLVVNNTKRIPTYFLQNIKL